MARVTEAHVEARRDQILDGAWACFAQKGYHQTTMQDIASSAGVSAGTIYLYFESKEAVLKAINDRSLEMGRELVAGARSRMEDPLDALNIIGEAMLSVFYDPMFETTTRVNIEILPEVIRNEGLRKNFAKELGFWRAAVAELLGEAQEKGELRAGVDASSLAASLICAWDGLRHFRLIDPDAFQPQLLLDLMRPLLTEERTPPAGHSPLEHLRGHEPALGPPFGMPPKETSAGGRQGE